MIVRIRLRTVKVKGWVGLDNRFYIRDKRNIHSWEKTGERYHKGTEKMQVFGLKFI